MDRLMPELGALVLGHLLPPHEHPALARDYEAQTYLRRTSPAQGYDHAGHEEARLQTDLVSYVASRFVCRQWSRLMADLLIARRRRTLVLRSSDDLSEEESAYHASAALYAPFDICSNGAFLLFEEISNCVQCKNYVFYHKYNINKYNYIYPGQNFIGCLFHMYEIRLVAKYPKYIKYPK